MTAYLVFISAALALLSGVYVLARGNWRPFGLKFAAVSLSTTSSLVMLALAYQTHAMLICQHDTLICLSRDIYILMRNLSIVFFHVALGRDAIRYKFRDRRNKKRSKDRKVA